MKRTLILILLAAMAIAVPSTAAAQSDPSQAETDAARREGPCSDPWVTLAIKRAKAGGFPVGRGDGDECATKLYNNGQWNSYAQLAQAVDQTLRSMQSQGVEIRMVNGAPALVMVNARAAVAAGLIGQDAASLIGDGGGTIAQGWGSIVAAGGGNVADRHVSSADAVNVRLPSGKVLFVRIRR